MPWDVVGDLIRSEYVPSSDQLPSFGAVGREYVKKKGKLSVDWSYVRQDLLKTIEFVEKNEEELWDSEGNPSNNMLLLMNLGYVPCGLKGKVELLATKKFSVKLAADVLG